MRFLLLIFTVVSSLFASSVDSLFNEANSLYNQQLYDSASVLYSEAIKEGGENSAIYYNLANCSYRLGRIGEAVLYTEKAKKLNPKDKDIQANLKYLQTQIVDEVPKVEHNPISDVVLYVHNFFSLQIELWIAVVLSFLTLLFVVLTLFNRGAARIWGIYLIGINIVIGAILATSIGIKIRDTNKKYAIVLESSVDANSEPGAGQLIFTIHEGTKVQIIKDTGNWYLVSLPNGTSGYIRKDSVGTI